MALVSLLPAAYNDMVRFLALSLSLVLLLEQPLRADDASDVTQWQPAHSAAVQPQTKASQTDVSAADVSGPAAVERQPGSGAGPTAVAIELAGGSLKRAVGGPGTANVRARVTNRGGRALLGLRIAAYYDLADMLPAADASWRLHEFVLEPPLPPGGSSQLEFSDEDAGEYVLLQVAYARFALAIVADGSVPQAATQELLLRDGVQYIAARDLATALGAQLQAGADKQITLSCAPGSKRQAFSLTFAVGSAAVQVGGKPQQLAHPVLEQAGRSYLPLPEVTAVLGYASTYDLGSNSLTLTTR